MEFGYLLYGKGHLFRLHLFATSRLPLLWTSRCYLCYKHHSRWLDSHRPSKVRTVCVKMFCFSWKMVLEHEKASVATAKCSPCCWWWQADTVPCPYDIFSHTCLLFFAFWSLPGHPCVPRSVWVGNLNEKGVYYFNYKQVGLLARI